MKLFKNLVDAVQDSLKQIMFEKKYSDKVLERVFKSNPQWGARDRKFIAEAVYDITRHFRYLSVIAGSERSLNMIFAAYLVEKGIALPDWPDFKSINTQLFTDVKKRITSAAIIQSYPDELWNYCEKELGTEKWNKEAIALNTEAKVVLRANTLKISKANLANKLKESGIETEDTSMAQDALQLSIRKNVFSSELFKEGFFEVQDAGSQLIAEFLNVEPGQKVIDACAGAGGKSLHLAALMKNKGKIIAMDVEEWKLENLKKRAKRAGAFNIEARLIDNNKTIKQLENSADRLLLDVPCSGTGVIKRNPDTKWKTTPEIIEKTKELQYKILSEYSTMLKSGGFLVYSTCSVLPSENEMQVKKFLETNSGMFSLIKDKTIYPSEGYDGFYMALLKKN
ncbi:MAG TPA: RsmB/NOP family class I SAM-dependent RNA methyltransferase [Bacteroidia bacterium]|nr:RsmB/NOP family class I SAM-dependent RNA methyltransferase [Bacteroidia bacterium]